MKHFYYLLWTVLLSISVVLPLHAELTYEGDYNPDQSLQEYFNEESPQYEKSIIYVFYNDVDMSCENCAQTIELIENIYNENYKDTYSLFIINYGDDEEYNFIETYQLNQPFEVVMVKVDDGATFGFKKLENLNYQISDPTSFSDNFQYQINSFLQTD